MISYLCLSSNPLIPLSLDYREPICTSRAAKDANSWVVEGGKLDIGCYPQVYNQAWKTVERNSESWPYTMAKDDCQRRTYTVEDPKFKAL